MGLSFTLQPTTIIALAIGCMAAFIIFNKMIANPKNGIYLVIIATPFTMSLGSNALMRRFTIAEIAGLLLLLAWFLNQIFISGRYWGPFSSFTPVAWSLAFVVVLSISVNLAYIRPTQSIVEFMVLLYILIFYTLFEQLICTEEDIRNVINVWLVVAAVVVIIGLSDMGTKFWGLPTFINLVGERYEWRTSATFRTTGQLGVYLFTTFWIVLASYFRPDTSKKYRFALLLVMLGIVIVSLFASRRSAFASFFVSAGVFTLINLRNPKQINLRNPKQIALWTGLILCIVFIILGVLNINEDFSRYFSNRIAVLQPTKMKQVPFIQTQIGETSRAFWENPVLGIGFGGFRNSRYDSTGNEIHSAPTQMLIETGIIGFLVYLFFLGMLLKLAYENAFTLDNPKWSQFSSVIFAALFGLYTSALYNRHLRERSFWVLIGIIVCINRLAKWKAQQELEQQDNQDSSEFGSMNLDID